MRDGSILCVGRSPVNGGIADFARMNEKKSVAAFRLYQREDRIAVDLRDRQLDGSA